MLRTEFQTRIDRINHLMLDKIEQVLDVIKRNTIPRRPSPGSRPMSGAGPTTGSICKNFATNRPAGVRAVAKASRARA
jgi:hypothetical protein